METNIRNMAITVKMLENLLAENPSEQHMAALTYALEIVKRRLVALCINQFP